MDPRSKRTVVTEEPVEAPVAEERTVVRDDNTASGRTIGSRVVWYIVGVIVALIVLRLILLLLAANQGSPFVDFIYGISGLFTWPFQGIFGEPTYGQSVLDSASLVAIVVYLLLGWGIAKLFTLTARRDDV